MAPVLQSKKVWVSIIGSAIGLTFALLAWAGLNIPADVRTGINELIVAIVGSFNIGQGIADGLSRGRTSGYARAAQTVKKLAP
jgi:uncharacterized membrane protein